MGESFNRDVASSQRCETGSFNLAAAAWPTTAKDTSVSPESVAVRIVSSINNSLASGDSRSFSELFLDDGYVRDHLAVSWELRTIQGKESIRSFLGRSCNLVKIDIDSSSAWRAPVLTNFAPVGDVRGIQFYTIVATKFGSGRGVVRLMEKEGAWKIWTFFKCLEQLSGFEEPKGRKRPQGVEHGEKPGRKNWLDKRIEDLDFTKSDPAVLVIGAGQGGLTVHARLKMLGVPTLIIDSNDAVGDNWRKRYHQLVLHDPVWYDHMPYMKFPDYWPVFTPKDKLADWFDTYAKSLELNVWMRSSLKSASWSETEKEWTVVISHGQPDGSVELRTLHPKHIIQATGHSGKKHFPQIPGRQDFQGDLLCHSAEFPGAKEDGKGRVAVVIGACNSSHDICQDYHEKGYDVTMVQRSTTCVVSSEALLEILLGGVFEEGGPPPEDGDIWMWGWPSQVLKSIQTELVSKQWNKDKETLQGLERVGFKLDKGPDDAGLFIKYLQRGGGYYLDVGASKLIIDGKIKVKQGQEVTEILPRGLKFSDGSELKADEVIFATGYENMRTEARSIFGDELADHVTDVWGWDEEGECRGFWRHSGHPGFWFQGGNMAMCRYFSRVLALQIKARLEGLA